MHPADRRNVSLFEMLKRRQRQDSVSENSVVSMSKNTVAEMQRHEPFGRFSLQLAIRAPGQIKNRTIVGHHNIGKLAILNRELTSAKKQNVNLKLRMILAKPSQQMKQYDRCSSKLSVMTDKKNFRHPVRSATCRGAQSRKHRPAAS